MANTIRGTLEEEQRKTNSREDETVLVDIDLTASLIDKNLSEILCSLQTIESENTDDTTQAPPSVPVKLTARRNQLSPAKATALIDFVLENKPATIEETITTEDETDKTGEQEDEENPSLKEIATNNLATDKTEEERTTPSAENTTSVTENTSVASKDDEYTTDAAESDQAEKITDSTEVEATTTRIRPAFVKVQSLDLGWNQLGGRSGGKALNAAVRKLLANPDQCPSEVRLDVCGLHPQACRDLAKGIVERHKGKAASIPPLSLNLACNDGIGDAGVAALAAAIRTVASGDKPKPRKKRKKRKVSKQEPREEESSTNESSNKEEEPPKTILKRLDLSGCGIGDAGAEALAIALANNPLCVQDLDLSNNQITDQGAAALAKALENGLVERLDLSHNPKLGDAGAKALAQAFEQEGIFKLILRSCKVRADGAACFGKALKNMGSRGTTSSSSSSSSSLSRLIDLSGNPLGILSKTKKSGNKLSATALRSKATDTTKAYMNIIGKSLQKGLNSIQGTAGGMDTLESDDEEEAAMGEAEEEDESRKKCAALSFAEAFIREGNEEKTTSETVTDGSILSVTLGFRHCGFDTRAAEALAAILVESKEEYPGMQLNLDMAMNDVLEDEFIAALHGEDDDQLADMAEVYLDALEVMREARQRALEASRMAAARAKATAEREAEWASPPPSFGDDDDWDNEKEWEQHYDDDDYDQKFDENFSDEEW